MRKWIFQLVIINCFIGITASGNEVFLEAGFENYSTSHFWNKDGKRLPTYNSFREQDYYTFIYSRLSQKDVIGLFAIYTRIKEDLNGSKCGFGDMELSWRRHICCLSGHSFSFYLIGMIPAEDKFKPALRYGKPGGEGGFGYTYFSSLNGYPLYFDATLGYRIYDSFPSDQFRGSSRLTACFTSFIQLHWDLSLEYGVFNGRSRMNESYIALNSNYRLLNTAIYANFLFLTNISAHVGYFRHVWGRNVGTGGGGFGGLAIHF